MAQNLSYPDATPVGTDKVMFIDAPGGSPSDKLATVDDLRGLSWGLTIDESGASLANWTQVSGTWTAGSYFTCTANGMLRYTTGPLDLSMCVWEVEMLVSSGTGGDRYAQMFLTSTSATNETASALSRIQYVASAWKWEADRGAQVNIMSAALAGGAYDVWFKMRQVCIGNRTAVYVDGTLVVTFDVSHDFVPTVPALLVTGAPVQFRNLKLWQPNLRLPS